MQIEEKIETLYDKDIKEAYQNLKDLEKLSEEQNVLYSYFDEFLQMIDSTKYVIRVRGFRLLCKQAKWDINNKINQEIDKILVVLDEEKPTALRQYLQAIKDIILYKKELQEKIKENLLAINYLKYKDSMQSLIFKDISEVLNIIEKN